MSKINMYKVTVDKANCSITVSNNDQSMTFNNIEEIENFIKILHKYSNKVVPF
jgi:hypothetical protein